MMKNFSTERKRGSLWIFLVIVIPYRGLSITALYLGKENIQGNNKKKVPATPPPFQREATKGFLSIPYYRKLSGKASQLLRTIEINTAFISPKPLQNFLCGFKHQYHISQSKGVL